MQGMSERELIELSDPENADIGKAPWIYWPTELYSHGKYIRKYGFYPNFLPVFAYGDHGGVMGRDEPYKHELETDAPVYFAFSRKKAEIYQNMTGKETHVIIWPALFYRKYFNIQKSPNAKRYNLFCCTFNTWY
jgi:hypothetical protein